MNKLSKRPFTLAFTALSFVLMVTGNDAGAFCFMIGAAIAFVYEEQSNPSIMNKSIEQVAEFHKVSDHPIAASPIIPDMATVSFRINFMIEELNETLAAAKAGDLIELADGLTDIQYVLDGFYLNAGLHHVKDALSAEVHRSNMSKFCDNELQAMDTVFQLSVQQGIIADYKQVGDKYVVYRTFDGKVMKALGYSKPDLRPIIYPE